MAKTKKRRKKTGTNKSAAIRAYMAANPHAGPTEVVQELGKKGVKVTTVLVSNVKMNAAKKKTGKKKRKQAGGSKVLMVSVSSLVEAKKLVNQLGGISQAQEALSALSKLQ